LVLVLFLVANGRLPAPLLYLSAYLERNRDAYYAALRAVRGSGDPSPWVDLFLTSVRVEAMDAVGRAKRIVALRDRYLDAAASLATANAVALVGLICENPVVTTRSLENRLGVSRPTALRLLRRMEERGVLSEQEQGARGQRRYVATDLRELMMEGAS
jgi:Fic family protein